MDPLWNSLVVGGLQTDKEGQVKPFLGFIGMIGTHYEDAHIATGAPASEPYGTVLVNLSLSDLVCANLPKGIHKVDMVDNSDYARQLQKQHQLYWYLCCWPSCLPQTSTTAPINISQLRHCLQTAVSACCGGKSSEF